MVFTAPDTLNNALQQLADGRTKIVAGCTDYFPALGAGPAPAAILDVSGLRGLRGIARNGDVWTIGAATTWSDIIKAELPPAFDGLRAAACEVGSVQIQNAGTVAGNLCNASPAADGVPPLLTLGARVEMRSLAGARTVALSDFITGVRRTDLRADELVTAIHVPAAPDGARGHFVKLGARRQMVISIASAAALVVRDAGGRIETARVAVGSCSAVAQRQGALETALIGQTDAQLARDPGIWARHLGQLRPISDARAPADYRQMAAGELCRRAVLGALGDDAGVGDG
jgi:CO/xanthine dehydrogenase FAD-binding subunit